MNEIWKDIKDFEGLYEVSNLGRIRSLDRDVVTLNGQTRHYKGEIKKGRIKKGDKKCAGYVIIDLFKNNKRYTMRVHRIVAEAFIPNPYNKEQVNHIDGNKENNTVENLEWCNQSENMKHAYSNDLAKPVTKQLLEHAERVSLKVALCDKDFNTVKEFKSISELTSYINGNYNGVADALRKQNGKAIYKKKFYIKYI